MSSFFTAAYREISYISKMQLIYRADLRQTGLKQL